MPVNRDTTTCPICGEFEIEDQSDAHDACDLEEMERWNLGFGVTYSGDEDALGCELTELRASCFALLEFLMAAIGTGVLIGWWVARKFSGRDRV